MGGATRQSINQLKDKVPPPVAAYAVYRAKGEIAYNGGIMRCAPVAIARRRHPALLGSVVNLRISVSKRLFPSFPLSRECGIR